MTAASLPPRVGPERAAPGRPDRIVIDTSVAIKWYLPEGDSAEAMAFMVPRFERHAPAILPVEASHALLKRSRRKPPEVSAVQALGIVRELRDAAPIRYHPDAPLLDEAIGLAVEIGCSSYDALFLALAVRLDGRVVTADRKFFDKVRASRHAWRGWWFLDPP